MSDIFEHLDPTLESPASHAAAITPDDDNDLTTACRGIYVGGAGDVEVITVGGETVVFSAAVAGTILPVRCSRVKATNTTATLLLALY